MELLCRICGEILQPDDDTGVCDCESCGSRQTYPMGYDSERLEIFNKARSLRQKTDFEGAEKLLVQLCAEVPDEPEGFWELALCRCGIVYENGDSAVKVPVCRRASLTPVTEDVNYLTAIAYATDEQKAVYCREAAAIDVLRREFAERVGNGERYDVFICGSSSEKGEKIASEIYDQLCEEGFSVFYAPKSIKEVSGRAGELYINAAINSAEALLVVCADPEGFAQPHMKSQWSRCASAVRKDGEKLLITCISGVSEGDIPEELSDYPVMDMEKLGFMAEVIRLIRRRDSGHSASARKAPEKLIRRMNIFLADEDFEAAEEYCDIILDASPECWQAYWARFLAYNGCRNNGDLLLEEVVESFASDYIEHFGYDFAEDDVFGAQLAQLLGDSPRKALEYAEDDEKLNLETVYERFVNAVRDAVFNREQENIETEEKQELEEIRRRHDEEEERKTAAENKKQAIRNRYITYAAVIFTVLIIICVKFSSILAGALIVIMIIVSVLVLGGLNRKD